MKPQVSDQRAAARAADSELSARFDRYQSELGLSAEHADLLTASPAPASFFEAALAEHGDGPAVAAWIVNDLRGLLGDRTLADLPMGGRDLGRLAGLVAAGTVSRRAAKNVLAHMAEQGGDPGVLVEEMGLTSLSDADVLSDAVEGVLGAWPDKVEAYRAGKKSLIGLFVGEVMKATKGAADPKAVRTMLSERLDS